MHSKCDKIKKRTGDFPLGGRVICNLNMTTIQSFTIEKIKQAGNIALEYFNKPLTKTEKGHPVDFVTEGDIAVNTFLVNEITATFPNHTIVSEELDDVIGDAEYTWYIDPIDGTFNYGNRIPVWAIMISVQKAGKDFFSAVYFPVIGDLYTADEQYSYRNGERLAINDKTVLEGISGIAVRMPKARVTNEQKDIYERYHHALTALNKNTQAGVVGYHCACIGTALATGAFSFVTMNAGYAWDWLPIAHICRNAGAVVSNSYGQPYDKQVRDIVISVPGIHTQLLSLFDIKNPL